MQYYRPIDIERVVKRSDSKRDKRSVKETRKEQRAIKYAMQGRKA